MLVVWVLKLLWQFQLHTHVKKIGFREISNTHMHQVHHAQNIEYMTKPWWSPLNVFDRILGLQLDESITIQYSFCTQTLIFICYFNSRIQEYLGR
jgi:sterol desaturase/sphingolipid hydroxylase (fatty acid hydroxylase superfamily)